MKKVLRVTANVLAWIVLIIAFLVTIIVFSSGKNNGVANIFGFIPMTVESDSMKPTFSKGDLIICKEIDDLNSLKEGDVITFWTVIDGQRVKNTHRIVEVEDNDGSRNFITRGDNNSVNDTSPAYSGDLIGKWTETKISGVGKVLNFMRTKKGFFICIVLPMALFFLFELYKFIVALIEAKRPDPAEQLDEEEIKRRAIEEYLASKGESAEAAAAKASEAVSSAAGKAAENLEEAKKEAVEKFEDVKDKAEKLIEEAKNETAEKIEETAEKTADNAKNIAENAAETAESVAEAAEKTGEAAE